MRLAPRFAEPRLGGLKSLFSWWENIGLQARFMVIASVGLLTLAIGALAIVDWYEFSSFEQRLKAFSENELRSLNSLVESAMERRLGDQQNVAIKVFNGWFESRNKEYAGKLWSVWGTKTKAYMAGTAPERAPKMPLDAIDEEALRTGQPVDDRGNGSFAPLAGVDRGRGLRGGAGGDVCDPNNTRAGDNARAKSDVGARDIQKFLGVDQCQVNRRSRST